METHKDNRFHPPFHLRHPAVQTVLASSRIRRLGRNPMLEMQEKRIVDAGSGIRLSGCYTPSTTQKTRGMVILLHGWEGSVQSTYVLGCGRFLHRNGFDIFRLNYRDHGDSHHLNRGLFYATRLEEVFQAVRQVSRHSVKMPVFLAGFSLGGNFVLRIAAKEKNDPIDNLKTVVAISPVLDPDKATDRIDRNPFLLYYFIRKWKKSLQRKQQLFPEHYDFGEILGEKTIRRMTEMLLETYSTYPDAPTYFREYGVYGQDLCDIRIPTTIITAADDPVIPVDDFYELKLPACAKLRVHTHGGHNGFVDSLFGPAWYERFMLENFT